VDTVGRVVGERLQSSLGQPFLAENKTGAGGAIGAEQVAKSSADGYTLLLTTSALNMNSALQGKNAAEVFRDLEPIALATWVPAVLVVPNNLGVNTVQELIAMARAKPGKLTFSSAGNGSPAHLFGEMLKSAYKLDMVHVPYKGGPQAMTDLMAGRVDMHFANAAVAIPQIKAGSVRALAVTSAKRTNFAPDVPTMSEAGVPDFEADQWIGYFATRGENVADVMAIAAPLHLGSVTLGVAVAGPLHRMQDMEKRHSQKLLAALKTIEKDFAAP
jgi:tripartite-type tricarboxylate transporter receptor subunit TctC